MTNYSIPNKEKVKFTKNLLPKVSRFLDNCDHSRAK